jgi:hypothetical protein
MKHFIPDWQPPEDWDKLPTAEKLDRLNKIQEEIKKRPKEK